MTSFPTPLFDVQLLRHDGECVQAEAMQIEGPDQPTSHGSRAVTRSRPCASNRQKVTHLSTNCRIRGMN